MKKYDDLFIQGQSRHKSTQKRHKMHLGYDTETIDGKLKLICLASKGGKINKSLYIEDTQNFDNIDSILKFLTNEDYRRHLKWFYNIDYDFRAVLKWLPETIINELYEEKKVIYQKYTISYLPRKFFSISKNKKTWVYYDVMQFYPGGLDKNAKKYLNSAKDDKINSEILGSDINYWKENRDSIIKYCIQDCKITAGLIDLFYSNLWSEIKFNPQKPYSSGSISQEYFCNKSFIPTIKNIPSNVLKLHQDNFRGGRIEILKRGHFDDLFSYDIKSAYPAQMINLLDYSNGQWIKSIEYDENIHGIYEIEYNWYDRNIGIFAQTYDGMTIYPNGEKIYNVVNEQELIFLADNPNLGDFRIINGYQFIPYVENYPYRDTILELFQKKEGATDPNKRMIYKLFINSIYGKTAQAIYDKKIGKYKTGKLYNPIYSNRITSLTRLELIKKSMKNGENIIGYATDSIHSTNEIKGITGKKLGDFTFEYRARDSVILMAGMRYTDGREKTRGMPNKLKMGSNTSDTFGLKEILYNNLEKNKIPVYFSSPVTIFQALNWQKYKKDDMNVFMPVEKILDINGDNRRIWLDDFIDCRDCINRNIDSSPIMI